MTRQEALDLTRSDARLSQARLRRKTLTPSDPVFGDQITTDEALTVNGWMSRGGLCAMSWPMGAVRATSCATPYRGTAIGPSKSSSDLTTRKAFEMRPRRWVVERTSAWLGRCRRLAKDGELSIESSAAWATVASIRMLIRRISESRISES